MKHSSRKAVAEEHWSNVYCVKNCKPQKTFQQYEDMDQECFLHYQSHSCFFQCRIGEITRKILVCRPHCSVVRGAEQIASCWQGCIPSLFLESCYCKLHSSGPANSRHCGEFLKDRRRLRQPNWALAVLVTQRLGFGGGKGRGSWRAGGAAAAGMGCRRNSSEGGVLKIQTSFLFSGRQAACGLAQNALQQYFLHVKLMVSAHLILNSFSIKAFQ